jgi:hypothetical protein
VADFAAVYNLCLILKIMLQNYVTNISLIQHRLQIHFYTEQYKCPIPVAARSKAWVCGRSIAADCGFESRRGNGCLSFVGVVCCQIEVSASG